MSEDEKVLEVLWHECGHLIVSLISDREINGFSVTRLSQYNGTNLLTTYGGNILLIPTIDDDSKIDITDICYKVFNYFSGSILQSTIGEREAINLFTNGKGNRDSDYSCFVKINDNYKLNNQIDIMDVCLKYFKKLENIILSDKDINRLLTSTCDNLLDLYKIDKPVVFKLDEISLKKTIADFKLSIVNSNLKTNINKLVKELEGEIRQLKSPNC